MRLFSSFFFPPLTGFGQRQFTVESVYLHTCKIPREWERGVEIQRDLSIHREMGSLSLTHMRARWRSNCCMLAWWKNQVCFVPFFFLSLVSPFFLIFFSLFKRISQSIRNRDSSQRTKKKKSSTYTWKCVGVGCVCMWAFFGCFVWLCKWCVRIGFTDKYMSVWRSGFYKEE